MSRESAPSAAIPATIQALLGARLDQIPDAERQVLERAAVIGRDFGGEPLLAVSRADGFADNEVRSRLSWPQRRRLIARAGPAACSPSLSRCCRGHGVRLHAQGPRASTGTRRSPVAVGAVCGRAERRRLG